MSTEKERETLVYMAKLSDQAQRYHEMVEFMKKVAKLNVELTIEERNMLAIAYKNAIGERRTSRIILLSIEHKEAQDKESNVKLIEGRRNQVEKEIFMICKDILSLIDEHLLPSSNNVENTVFYYKLKGDYHRYLAEFKKGQDKEEASEQSFKAYETASAIANTELPPANPIRLGIALNFSVFYYEIMNSSERAIHLAEQAYDEAVGKLDSLSKESYDYSNLLIMQLLKDNLTRWTKHGGKRIVESRSDQDT